MQCSVVTLDTFWGIVRLLGHDGRKCIDDDAMRGIRESPEYSQLVGCVASNTTILMSHDTVGLPPAYFAAAYAAPCDDSPHYLMFTNVSDMFQRVMDMYDDAASLGHEVSGDHQEQRRHMLEAAITNMEHFIEVASLTDALSAM